MKFPWVIFAVWSAVVPGRGEIPRDPYLAVVRQASGVVRVFDQDTLIAMDAKLGDLAPSGGTFITGWNGLLVIRFHPDFTRLEARSNTRYWLGYSRYDSTRARRIKLEQGQLVLGISKRGPSLKVEYAHSWARAEEARFSLTSDLKASTITVLDGLVEVHNYARDETVMLRRGQKAVSDAEGLRISDAADADLEQVGLRQNTLEVDFINPATEEFNTLELEYESNF